MATKKKMASKEKAADIVNRTSGGSKGPNSGKTKLRIEAKKGKAK